MTLRDDPRTYKKPVEEVAKTLSSNLGFRMALALVNSQAYDENLSVLSDDMARQALKRLRELGFLSDLGIEAIRAEEAGK